MAWPAPLNGLIAPRSNGPRPAMPVRLSRAVHRACTALGTPARVGPDAWRAEMAALAVYAAETPGGQSLVQMHAGDGRATAALAVGTAFARRPALWAVDRFAAADAAGGRLSPVRRALAATGLDAHAVAVDAGPAAAAKAWDGSPVGLLVIDAGGGAAACMSAYEAWSEHLADGSRVIFAGAVNPSSRLFWGGGLEPLFTLGGLRVCAHHARAAAPAARARPALRRAA